MADFNNINEPMNQYEIEIAEERIGIMQYDAGLSEAMSTVLAHHEITLKRIGL